MSHCVRVAPLCICSSHKLHTYNSEYIAMRRRKRNETNARAHRESKRFTCLEKPIRDEPKNKYFTKCQQQKCQRPIYKVISNRTLAMECNGLIGIVNASGCRHFFFSSSSKLHRIGQLTVPQCVCCCCCNFYLYFKRVTQSHFRSRNCCQFAHSIHTWLKCNRCADSYNKSHVRNSYLFV